MEFTGCNTPAQRGCLQQGCKHPPRTRDGRGSNTGNLRLIMRRLFYLILFAALGSVFAGWLSAAEPLIKLDLAGRTLEGTPLAWSQEKIFFLARDGQLNEFT